MRKDTVSKVTADLKEKYPDIGLHAVEVDDKSGKATFYMEPTQKAMAFLPAEKAATITRDPIDRQVLDLIKKDPYTDDPKNLFKKAAKYYYVDPLVGTVTNLLANLAQKGFENDIDDENIKSFYDLWVFDTNFKEILEWMFLDFFKIGHVTTYKAIAKYEPRVSHLSPIPGQKINKKNNKKATGKEDAAKKKIWSKGHLPIAYTVLNPELVTVDGSLLFDQQKITLEIPAELRELVTKSPGELTSDEKEFLKMLPNDLKKQAETGGSIVLDPRLVGTVTYKKQPYERYARPRATRIFESLDYKNSLRQADLSTLDGITNYILKITIGSDEFPVTTQEELEAVADLFNTPSKSFDVVWNHTLNVEKIISPEIGEILGQEKYAQVNDDITGGLAVSRALIDGISNVNAGEAALLIKGITEEINYARKQVTRWIYNEYRQIAEAMGFERFPKVRWDEGVLKDPILYMSTVSNLVDRRMLSYRTALEELGFDFPNELNNMEEEFPMVQEGIFGIIGSPWQQAAGAGGIQPTQRSPEGTPSKGRPTGQPAKKPKEKQPPDKTTKKQTKPPQKKQSEASLEEIVGSMTEEEYLNLVFKMAEIRKKKMDENTE